MDPSLPGCTPVSHYLPADIKNDLDVAREMERIHSLFFTNMEKLEKIQGQYKVMACVDMLLLYVCLLPYFILQNKFITLITNSLLMINKIVLFAKSLIITQWLFIMIII